MRDVSILQMDNVLNVRLPYLIVDLWSLRQAYKLSDRVSFLCWLMHSHTVWMDSTLNESSFDKANWWMFIKWWWTKRKHLKKLTILHACVHDNETNSELHVHSVIERWVQDHGIILKSLIEVDINKCQDAIFKCMLQCVEIWLKCKGPC